MELARGSSLHDVSCRRHGIPEASKQPRWIQRNEGRWKTWMPVETSCARGHLAHIEASDGGSHRGFGLVDGSGEYVEQRTYATACGLCPAGTSSKALQDEALQTL